MGILDCQTDESVNTGSINIHINIIIVLDILTALGTIGGNTIFLTTLIKTTSLHTPSNMLIGALCICDLLVGFVAQPVYLRMLFLMRDGKGEDTQTVFNAAFFWFSGLSCLLAATMSLDRYFAICHPFAYRRLATCKRHIIIATIISIIWSLYSIPFSIADRKGIKFLYTFVGYIFAVAAVISFSYVQIYRVMLAQRRTMPTIGVISGTEEGGNVRMREADKARTISFILGFFLLCHIPYLAFTIYFIGWHSQFCENSHHVTIMFLWDEYFLLLSSCVNPLVYGLRRREFKLAGLRIIQTHAQRLGSQNSRNMVVSMSQEQ